VSSIIEDFQSKLNIANAEITSEREEVTAFVLIFSLIIPGWIMMIEELAWWVWVYLPWILN
jgi:hypothetical protein